MRLRAALSIAALVAALPGAARADDGAYGRLDGDLAPSLEAGAELGRRVHAAAQMRALYLATVGPYVGLRAPGDEGARLAFSAGVEARPLFLPRFLKAREQGPAALDLLIDSLSLSVGAQLSPSAPPALELGAGLELPLMGRFDGLFLGLRYQHRLAHERLAGRDSGDHAALVTLGYRFVAATHLVDVGDALQR